MDEQPHIPDSEVELLFHQALELTDPEEREAFLDHVCKQRPELRRRLESLLSADQIAARYLDEDGRLPATTETRAQPPRVTVAEGPGSTIGGYQLLQKLGEGGMGIVYLAEHVSDYQQRVALKIIKPGMDSRQVIARFEAERQALALMDHPNIARVLDGGTTGNGRPYFVMQYVRGISITQFADREHLSSRERLELFRVVCQAVQHAHNKGIVHRDIKPSNILVSLVDGKPAPVVIDFGVAKALNQRLTEKTLFTEQGQMVGTPAYMSPEQAAADGMDIDARSDIYSLGVLLYELLVGKTPFDERTLREKGYDEIRRIIREVEPQRPSTRLSTLSGDELTTLARRRRIDPNRLGRFLRGDLDLIVMKAISKERSRRYHSATSLAEDVGRFIEGDTILAVPPSAGYRLGKFVRRHRKTVAALGAVLVMLVMGVIGTTWQAVRADRARAQAENARRDAEEVIRFLNAMLEEVRPAKALGRDTAMLKELLDKTAARVGTELKDQPAVAFRLLATMGRTYEALGAFPSAEALQREAIRMVRTGRVAGGTNLVAVLTDLGLTLQWQGRYLGAADTVRESLDLAGRLGLGDNVLRAAAEHRLGSILRFLDELPEAERHLTNAVDMQTRLLGADHPDTLSSERDLAVIYFDLRRFDDLEPLILRVVDGRRRVSGPEHPDTLKALELVGLMRMMQGRYVEAEEQFRDLLEIRRRILPPTHAHTLTTIDYLGLAYGYTGNYRAAESLCREALDAIAKVESLDQERALVYRSNLAEYVRNQGRYRESERMFLEVMAAQDASLTADHLNRFETQNSLSLQYYMEGRYEEAEDLARRCLQGRIERAGLAESDPRVGDALSQLGLVLLARKAYSEAEPYARRCLANRQAGQATDWRLAVAKAQLGACLLGLDRDGEAEPLLVEGFAELKARRTAIPAVERARLIEAGVNLEQLYQKTGRASELGVVSSELAELRRWALPAGS